MAALAGQVLGELTVALAERADALREEIRAKLGEAADAVLATEHQWSDAGAAAAEADVELAEASRDIAELAAVRMAQARIDEGRYGDCFGCGAPIPLPRLRAQPAALRCVVCQEKFESRMQAQPA